MSHTTNKQKTKTKDPQQNMLNHLCHLCQTQQTQKQKTNKRASTEHVKSGYVTHNKKAKTKTKEPQQNMLSQLMSRRCDRQKPHFFMINTLFRNCNFE
jgi:hypothetical protein